MYIDSWDWHIVLICIWTMWMQTLLLCLSIVSHGKFFFIYLYNLLIQFIYQYLITDSSQDHDSNNTIFKKGWHICLLPLFKILVSYKSVFITTCMGRSGLFQISSQKEGIDTLFQMRKRNTTMASLPSSPCSEIVWVAPASLPTHVCRHLMDIGTAQATLWQPKGPPK